MKCPKCGYTSFDYLESCKKCNNALGEFKAKYGLRSLLFPNRTSQPTETIAPALAAVALTPAAAATDTAASTDFGYDFDSETPAAAAAPVAAPQAPAVTSAAADSFDFDSDWDAPAEPTVSAAPPAEEAADSFDFDSDWDAPAEPVASTQPPAEEAADSLEFDSDWDAPAEPVVSAQPPAEEAADSFEFDSDWDAPATPVVSAQPPAEEADDSFDFMDDVAEASPGFTAVGDELDLGEDSPSLEAAAEENAFELEGTWGETTPEPAPAVAGVSEEPLPEFAAESFDFAEESAEDAISFNDEFDFTDDEMPDLLSSSEESTTKVNTLGAKEGPSDPFEQRESAQAGPTPVESTSTEEPLVDQPAPAVAADSEPGTASQDDPDQLELTEPAQPEPRTEASFAPMVFAETAETDEALLPLPDPAAADEDELTLDDGTEAVEEPALARPGPTGPPFFRIGAGAFDLLLLGVIYALFLAAGKLALFPADQAMAPIPLESLADLAIPYFLILFALCFGYFTLFHFLSGQTPGKMIFRLKVESATGAPIDFAQAFLRSVGGLISLLCGGIGFLFMLRAPEHRGWNDRLAGTRVIDTSPPQAILD